MKNLKQAWKLWKNGTPLELVDQTVRNPILQMKLSDASILVYYVFKKIQKIDLQWQQ
jgi:hypothetical protein